MPGGVAGQKQWIPVPERRVIIPDFYQAMIGNHNANLDAVVTYQGLAIQQGGETLTIGLVPPERRWAIGEAKDGRAEVLPQHVFENDHLTWWTQEFIAKGDTPDDHTRRYIPHVREFVSHKVDPANTSRLVPLGTDFSPGEPKRPEKYYRQSSDSMVDAEVWDRENHEQEEKISRLEALVEKLLAEKDAAPEVAVAPPPEPTKTAAPCGKEVQRVGPHMRWCKQPECVAARGEASDTEESPEE